MPSSEHYSARRTRALPRARRRSLISAARRPAMEDSLGPPAAKRVRVGAAPSTTTSVGPAGEAADRPPCAAVSAADRARAALGGGWYPMGSSQGAGGAPAAEVVSSDAAGGSPEEVEDGEELSVSFASDSAYDGYSSGAEAATGGESKVRGWSLRRGGERCRQGEREEGSGEKRNHELRVRLALPPGGRSRRAAWPGAVRARPFRREGGAGEGRGRLKGCAQGQAEGRGSEGAAVKGVGSWKERRGTFCVECSLGGGPCGRQRRARLWEGHQKGMSTAVGRGWGEGALSARARSARPTSSTRPVAAATYRLAPRRVLSAAYCTC